MNLRGKALRGSALLTASEVVVYGSSFLRNMMLARLLTKADMGIAATFAMVIALLEFSAKMGVARFVVRDKEGNREEFIASAHLVQVTVAAMSSLAILAAAWPLARLFDLEAQRWAMLILAVIPILRGLEHLDVRRYERELRFGPSAVVDMVPQVVITAAAYPVALWLGDFRAMLLLLIGKTLLSCVTSHVLAERPYRWRMEMEHVNRMARFGWPLVVTGLLLFGVMHGDQFLVATFYTKEDLGSYALAVALTMTPTFFFGRVFNSIMLPLMAKVQDDPAAFALRYSQAVAVLSAFAVVCGVGIIIGSEAIMRLVYGPKYEGTGIILAWLAASNAFRNLRIAPSLAAMSRGDSKNQMIGSLWRVSSLVPAFALAAAQQPLWMVAGTGLMGEMLACRAVIVRLRRRDGIPLSISVIPGLWVGMATMLALVVAVQGMEGMFWPLAIAAAGALSAGLFMVLVTPVLRNEARNLRARWGVPGWRRVASKGLGVPEENVAEAPGRTAI